jgi:tight adherence protein B
VSRPLAILIALIGGYALIRGFFAWETDRYKQKLFDQLPDVIELVISAVSAGMPVGTAFAQVARDVSAPTSDELSHVMADIAVGRSLDQAIMRIFERTRVAEYAILATTIGLQSDTGGRISESMENLGRIIRERQTVAERAKARASESKLSGNILAVMPIIFGGMMSVINPGYLSVFITNPSATRLLVVAVALLVFGILLMRYIIRWSLRDWLELPPSWGCSGAFWYSF